MRPNRVRVRAIAAWLGMLALGLNALVPIHLAFDLAHAAAPDHHHEAAEGLVGHLLTLLIGHHDKDHDQPASDKGSPPDHCAVCGAISTLAGFAPAAPALFAILISVGAATLSVSIAAPPRASPLVLYRARAPPFA